MSTPSDVGADATRDALRAEHDALARRLAVRTSIDEVRKGLYLGFLGLLSVGLSAKLAWDRWGTLRPGVVRKIHSGPPLFFTIAVAVALVLLVLAIRHFAKGRRIMREEDALFARYRQLRGELGHEP